LEAGLFASAPVRPPRPARPANETAGLGTGVFAVLQDLGAVDEDVADAGRELHRFLERGVVLHCRGVEDDDVGIIAVAKDSAALDAEIGRGEAPNCVTFTATANEDVIGTLTLTVDSPAGLAADRIFRDELDRFRKAPGAKICELTKLAFDTSSPARPRLAALFHIIFIYGTMHYNCTDLFIEVNPRHVRFYEAMLGFTRVGEVRMNETVRAPAQLMWLNVGEIRRYIDRDAGEDGGSARSLYRHFFSRDEEKGIYGRLARLAEQRSVFDMFSATAE